MEILDMDLEHENHKLICRTGDNCDWIIPQKWELFMGNNLNIIKNDDARAYGGDVNLMRYIGEKLNKSLWEDLLYRYQISGMCIYKPREEMWLFGFREGHCTIHLDNNDLIKAISIVPLHKSEKKPQGTDYVSILRSLRTAIDTIDGKKPTNYKGHFSNEKEEGMPILSLEQARENLEKAWAYCNKPMVIYESIGVCYVDGEIIDFRGCRDID